MKLRLLNPATAMFAFVLLTASAIADAAVNPRCAQCWNQYVACQSAGGQDCYTRYETCLYRNGCPVP